MRRFCFLLFALFLLPALSRAAEFFEYHRPINSYAMGGVFLPFVDEGDAVLWNPSRLATVDTLTWKLVNVGVGANGKEVYDLYKQMQDSSCSGSACYNNFYGKPLWVGYNGEMSFIAPRFGMTAFSMAQLQGTIHSPPFPSFNLTYLSDYGFAMGYGFPLAENVSGGVTVKRITRWGGDQELSLSSVTTPGYSILSDFNQRGTGYGLDLASTYKVPGPLDTRFVVHWQDVGSTAFAPQSGLVAPPRIKDNLSAGFGTQLDLPGLDVKVGAEYRHILDNGEQMGKKLHFGTEVGLGPFDLRAGLYQGYPTFGTSFDLMFLTIDAASYTVETGAYPGQAPSNRIKIGITIELSVGADFSLTDKNGQRRKLKQRR